MWLLYRAGMNRRRFLQQASAAALGATTSLPLLHADKTRAVPDFSTGKREWQAGYSKALEILGGNVQVLPRYDRPVLVEGSQYGGIWQECGPHESLVYRKFRPEVARNSHMIFFALQREDGQLPANNKRDQSSRGAGFGQIQMVVPIAATAWELAEATKDEELLETAYRACSRWDAWLTRYRNTRGTGLIEGFCTYDTGMDNSPRWAGMPNQCPNGDARVCPTVPTLPRLCPDLSATVFGARMALSEMAKALGKASMAEEWQEKAERLRTLILKRLYDAEDGAFYDLDTKNQFVKVRTCATIGVCAEHVVEQATFDQLWSRQIHAPAAFWPAYPLPSVAVDDPQFVRPIPHNSWGGASQALTALRAPRWMDFYGHGAELATMMQRWCEAILRDGTFRQQIDPATGEFTDGDLPGYSPAALVLVDFTWRLAGIHEEPNEIHWNVRPRHRASQQARFRLRTDTGAEAEMRYGPMGASLVYKDRPVASVEQGTVRLVTDKSSKPTRLVGIHAEAQNVVLRFPNHTQSFEILANQQFPL